MKLFSHIVQLYRQVDNTRSKKWRQEILAFFQFFPLRLSNGFVEGKNNRTKALMRQAYGYRNRRHLRLRILAGDLT